MLVVLTHAVVVLQSVNQNVKLVQDVIIIAIMDVHHVMDVPVVARRVVRLDVKSVLVDAQLV